MDTTQSKLYCGVHEDIWNNLLLKAEDLLRDEGLGAHLVGIYPSGKRIYGTRSGVENLMCLYVDSVESLINPVAPTRKCEVFTVDKDRRQIVMFNLFWWVHWVIHGPSDWKTLDFLHAIPFGDVIDQDESIADIIDTARKLLIIKRFASPMFGGSPTLSSILAKRTQLILSATGRFAPCINPEYAQVFMLDNLSAPKRIKQLDTHLREDMLAGAEPIHILNELDMWYRDMTHYYESQAKHCKTTAKQLGELTEKLYRFQL